MRGAETRQGIELIENMMSVVTYSPVEQFEVHRIIPLQFGVLDLSITNSTVYMLYAVLIYQVLYKINIAEGKLVPGRWQTVIELAYGQIIGLVMDNIGEGRYVPMIWALFINLSIMNLVGIVPYTFSPTAHIVVGIGMSVSILIGVTLLGIENYRSNYISMLMPGGAPLALAPFLVVIELVSQLAKGLSLGIRLAANITAGHLLFVIISGFAFTMITAGGVLSILSIFPIFIILFITILEMAVALIQAYVFSLLTAIYVGESIHLH